MTKNYNLAWCSPSNSKTQVPKARQVVDSDLIKQVLEQASAIKDQIIVIKLSDIIIANEILLTNFAENVSLLYASGARICIVHEYAAIVETKIQEFSKDSGFEHSHFGQDKQADLIEMIISGRINRDIVAKLCAHSVQVVGLSGKDNSSIVATKSKTITNPYQGDIHFINPDILLDNDSNEIVSVVSPIGCNEKGRTIILDASLTASRVAAAIGADYLIMFGAENYFSKNDLIVSDLPELQNILENTSEVDINSPEMKATKYAVQNAECSVYFLDANRQDELILKLFS